MKCLEAVAGKLGAIEDTELVLQASSCERPVRILELIEVRSE